jgi:hypothetical protein
MLVGMMCESWPSWFPCFAPLHLVCSIVYITLPKPPWLSALQHLYPGVNFVCGVQAPDFSSAPELSLWFLAGSAAWFYSLSYLIPSTLWAVVDLGPQSLPSPPGWHHCAFDPTQFGSVISGVCNIYLQNIACTQPPVVGYSRYLRHILDPVERSCCWIELSTPSPAALAPGDRLPISALF